MTQSVPNNSNNSTHTKNVCDLSCVLDIERIISGENKEAIEVREKYREKERNREKASILG